MTTKNDNAAALTDWDIAHAERSLHVDWTMIDGELVARAFDTLISELASELEATIVMRAGSAIIFDECA